MLKFMSYTPLMKAVMDENLKDASALIKKGVDVNEYNIVRTPLMVAVILENYDMVELLLDSDADPNLADEQEFTPLMDAAMRNDLEMVSILLEAGADVDQEDDCGMTASSYAEQEGYLQVSEYIDNFF